MIQWSREVVALARLALAKFHSLTEAELKLLCAAATAEFAICGPIESEWQHHNEPRFAEFWGLERNIRAAVIRLLCTDSKASGLVDPRGIRLHGAWIDGELDLVFVSVTFPLSFVSCRMSDLLALTSARTEFLSLAGTVVPRIAGDRLNVRGSLILSDGFRAEGGVTLEGAQIGGELNCGGGIFTNPTGNALTADGAHVDADVVLNKGFRAEGKVRLVGAKIGGQLNCSGGVFTNPTGDALSADGAHVDDVFLNKGFRAEGEVRLLGAKIGGVLDCSGGVFTNPAGGALSADRAYVDGVFLSEGFRAEGGVSVAGTQIGGQLVCRGGVFTNPTTGYALSAQGAHVDADVLLDGGFRAEGQVWLSGITIGGQLNCANGTFVKSDGDALVVDRATVAQTVLLSPGFSANGVVRLVGADFRGNLECRGASFVNGSKFVARQMKVRGTFSWSKISHKDVWLDLAHASVARLEDEKESWPAKSRLILDGFEYDRITHGPADAQSRLEWLRLQPEVQNPNQLYLPQPYQQLAKVLRERGDNTGARQVLIALEDVRREREALSFFPWLWRWILKLTIAYGYRPWYALYWALGVVVLGALLFWRGHAAGLVTPFDPEFGGEAYEFFTDYAHNVPAYYTPFNAAVYSLDAFLPIINLGLKEHWRPNANLGSSYLWGCTTTGGLLRIYLWVHTILGWLLTTLFVSGVVASSERYRVALEPSSP